MFFLLSQGVAAQNNTNSPYTRFGYGNISDNTSAEHRAMGGVAIGARSLKSINTVNPASYSAVDSMTFMFDVGASALATYFTDNANSHSAFNGNLEYITLQFPASKWLGFSAGVLPYSFAGYDFALSDSVYTEVPERPYVKYTNSFSGAGGISQVYMGLSLKLFNHIALGANAYYMWGQLDNNRTQTFLSSGANSFSVKNNITVNDFRFRYGAQFFHTFADKHEVTLGMIYEHQSELNGTFTQSELTTLDTINSIVDGYDLPSFYGGGLYYTYDDRLSIGMDYTMQGWSRTRYCNKLDSLHNTTKLAIGAEYMHDPNGKRYIDRVPFRLGMHASNSYVNNESNLFENYGISFGVGIPLRSSKTMINATFEYGKSGVKNLLREDYLKFTLSASINEMWFFKRKL